MVSDKMNDLPENIELMRKIVMGRIEDSLQNIPNSVFVIIPIRNKTVKVNYALLP